MEPRKSSAEARRLASPEYEQAEQLSQGLKTSEDAADVPIDDAVRTYLREIGRVPLLSEQQERALGDDLHRGNMEIMRALRSLHARIRDVLLQRDPTPVDEAAAAWAPLLGCGAATVAASLRRLLTLRATDAPELARAGRLAGRHLPGAVLRSGRGLRQLCAGSVHAARRGRLRGVVASRRPAQVDAVCTAAPRGRRRGSPGARARGAGDDDRRAAAPGDLGSDGVAAAACSSQRRRVRGDPQRGDDGGRSSRL